MMKIRDAVQHTLLIIMVRHKILPKDVVFLKVELLLYFLAPYITGTISCFVGDKLTFPKTGP